ncbi:hypothetical protein H0H92_010686 [Tricholoma furcatifolium]|nr:hypothetical protein H0H92_010686 [Tricholoma furcatifolium]
MSANLPSPAHRQSDFDVEKDHTLVGHDGREKWGTEVTNEEQNKTKTDGYPEGGFRAWSVLLGAFIAQFCTFGYTNAYGVYNDFYVRRYLNDRYTSSQISWIGSTQLLLVLFIGLFTGRAFDTGYFYHLMIGGSILLVFCIFMISLSQAEQYYQIFLAQGLGVGIAVGITYVPSVSILSHYFHRRRALAMGIAVSGSGLGGAVHTVMLNQLFYGGVGFRNGVRASAGMIGALLTVSILLMKPRLRPTSRKQGSTLHDLRVFLRDPPYVIMVFGTVLVFAGLYFPIFFLQLNAIKNGITPSLAFYMPDDSISREARFGDWGQARHLLYIHWDTNRWGSAFR